MRSSRSMRARMTGAFTLFIAVLLLLVCAGMLGLAKHAARREVDTLLNAAAVEVKSELNNELGAGAHSANWRQLLTEENDFLKVNDLALLVVDNKGQIIVRSQNEVPLWPLQNDTQSAAWHTATLQYAGRTIVIAASRRRAEAELRQQTTALLALTLVATLAAALGSWLLVGHTLAPIGLLAQEARVTQSQTGGSLHVRLTAPSEDIEVVDLVTTLNDLLTRLSAMAGSKGRFYAAASHELRTPLHALAGHLEVALSQPRTAGQYEVAFKEVQRQTHRLMSLVQALLILNQLDCATALPPTEPLNLAVACERAIEQLQTGIENHRLRLELSLPDLEISAPPAHVAMLVRNLVENAVKYAVPGSTIRLELINTGDAPQLQIHNDCMAGFQWEPEKYFEPFYRPDVSRNARTGGNGLGLSICKAITDANGWTLSLRQDGSLVRCWVVFGSQ